MNVRAALKSLIISCFHAVGYCNELLMLLVDI